MTTSLIRLAAVLSLTMAVVGCSTARVVSVPRARLTSTAAQTELLKSIAPRGSASGVCIGHLLAAADTARKKLAENPDDAIALSDYNFAVARIVGTIDDTRLDSWGSPITCGQDASGVWTLRSKATDIRSVRIAKTFRFVPADQFRFKGKLVGNRTIKQGLGAPLVVVGKDHVLDHVDSDNPNEDVFYGLTAVIEFDGQDCTLEFIDPLQNETIRFDGHTYPLRADFQAPLALSLVNSDPTRERLDGFFSTPEEVKTARLVRLQPYDSKKIPVIFIHGLGDTSAIWIPMIDFLRTDEDIRDRYQFWSFRYPSGIPYPLAAAILRRELDRFREIYPSHKDTVVIGHSMGGMIARLLVSESGMKLWDALYDTKPEDMDLPALEIERLRRALIFKARPDISRVIYASASHRGADLALGFLGRLGVALIGDPGADEYVSRKSLTYLRPEVRPKGRAHLPNSVALLAPDATVLLVGDTLPHRKGLKFNSLIGDQGLGGHLDHTRPNSTDSVVPYWSSHLPGAESELVIPSKHWSILDPLGKSEIKRILLNHK